MAEEKPDTRVFALEAENADLREEVETLRRRLRHQSADAADAAIATTRRGLRHEKEMTTERGRSGVAEDRASFVELRFTDLQSAHDLVVRNADFNRLVLETTTDCIKVLDLDGRLEFMNTGGQRVMEVDDFSRLAGCPWAEFWQGDERGKVSDAIAAAKSGRTTRFEGPANTAKGNPRYWEVTVAPILGRDGKLLKLLSISRDVTNRHAAEMHRRVLFEEMHHRIKNTLATVQGITHQSMRYSTDMMEAELSISQRLAAMGKAHDLLILNEWISADILNVVTDAVAAYIGDGARMTVDGPSIALSSKAALTIAMLLNELCTNAFKHGAWSNRAGFVDISWWLTGTTSVFRWAERGGPPVKLPTRRSFGSRLIERLMPEALRGRATLAFDPSGLVFQLEAPTSELTTMESINPDNASPLAASLKPLVKTAIEQTGGESKAAFFVVDANRVGLHHVTGMSQAYARHVDGFAIGPQSLACGLAAFTRKPVITPDVAAEPLWQPWLWLAREADYRACWSFPIETSEGEIVGAFAIYHKEPTEATPHDLDVASAVMRAAAPIISHALRGAAPTIVS
jgi:PAS domain S-box-containing protein